MREMVRERRANGRWIARSAHDARRPAERQASLLGSALLAYQCAFGDWFAHPARSARSSRCLSIAPAGWAFSSLLSGTPGGARLLLVCLP